MVLDFPSMEKDLGYDFVVHHKVRVCHSVSDLVLIDQILRDQKS